MNFQLAEAITKFFSFSFADIHKLVLTWIGVIFQLIWRFGTVTARILALVFFAAAYKNWIFLVVALHWLCMFLWNLIQTWVSFIENISTYNIKKCAVIIVVLILLSIFFFLSRILM